MVPDMHYELEGQSVHSMVTLTESKRRIHRIILPPAGVEVIEIFNQMFKEYLW
jgi:hypothetical protein